jgi:pSer/pThr/pTyr-binding forkhead associated (FHA) protein
LAGWQGTLWSLLALMPVLGLVAYLLARQDAIRLSMPAPGRQTPAQAGPRQTQVRPEAGRVRQATLAAGEYLRRLRPGPDPALPAPRITRPPLTDLQWVVNQGPGRLTGNTALLPGENWLGARPDAEGAGVVVLADDDTISASHALVRWTAEAVTLENRSQHSLTWVDGHLLKPREVVPLQPGSEIRLGSTSLGLRGAWPVAAPAPAGVRVPPPGPTRPEADRPESASAWRLVITEGPEQGQEIRLTSLPAVIGRAPDCPIRLGGDEYVSSQHARLYSQDGNLRIQNLSRTNGTTVNGYGIEDKELAHGDRIRIGHTLLAIKQERK